MKTPQPEIETAPIPTYRRIQDDLRGRVASRTWRPGQMLPSRRTLASEYGVSLPTMERAIADLLSDGTLRADGGRGTFVADTQTVANMPTGVAVDDFRERPSVNSALTIGVIYSQSWHTDRHEPKNASKEIMVAAVEQALSRNECPSRTINLAHGDGMWVSLIDGASELVDAGIGALVILMVDDPSMMADVVALCEPLRIPIVSAGSIVYPFPVASIFYDGRDAGYRAAGHLVRAGCRDILFFSPGSEYWVGPRRDGVEACCLASSCYGTTFAEWIGNPEMMDLPSLKCHPADTQRVAYEAAKDLLKSRSCPDGIVACNDAVALRFIAAAAEIGLRAGRDFAIVGFDDVPEARIGNLTTLRPPLEALGREAARMAMESANSTNEHSRICLHSNLIARGSTQLPSSRTAR